MTFARLHARPFNYPASRLYGPVLALGLCSAVFASAQEPGTTPAPVPVQRPAPIVRKAPATAAAPAPATAKAPTDTAPKPIHLTVAKPVVKPPQTNPDGTSVAPKPKPAAPKPAAKPGGSGPAAPGKPAARKLPASQAVAPTTAPGTAPVLFNRTVILLDPAHGGADFGSHITDQFAEKDATLALAFRLRSLLTARGFTVVMTRDTDAGQAAGQSGPGAPLTLDDRAGIANHAHPAACLLLHATASGEGIHLYSSELDPVPAEPTVNPWLTAQAAWVPASQALVNQLGTALTRARLPLVQSRASVRPVDSLTCPAVVLELAPDSAGNSASLADGAYQQRVADAVAASLVFWQNLAQPPVRLLPVAPPPAPPTVASPAPSATPEVQP